jgi:hypothetical protein
MQDQTPGGWGPALITRILIFSPDGIIIHPLLNNSEGLDLFRGCQAGHLRYKFPIPNFSLTTSLYSEKHKSVPTAVWP